MKSIKKIKPNPWPRQAEHRSKIRWLAPHEGGRSKPPSAGPGEYRGILRFDADPNHLHGHWGFRIRFEKLPTEDDLESVAYISAMSPEAPQHFLHEGATFEVQEGLKTVARGVALD